MGGRSLEPLPALGKPESHHCLEKPRPDLGQPGIASDRGNGRKCGFARQGLPNTRKLARQAGLAELPHRLKQLADGDLAHEASLLNHRSATFLLLQHILRYVDNVLTRV